MGSRLRRLAFKMEFAFDPINRLAKCTSEAVPVIGRADGPPGGFALQTKRGRIGIVAMALFADIWAPDKKPSKVAQRRGLACCGI